VTASQCFLSLWWIMGPASLEHWTPQPYAVRLSLESAVSGSAIVCLSMRHEHKSSISDNIYGNGNVLTTKEKYYDAEWQLWNKEFGFNTFSWNLFRHPQDLNLLTSVVFHREVW
jgi:hypothetical protein